MMRRNIIASIIITCTTLIFTSKSWCAPLQNGFEKFNRYKQLNSRPQNCNVTLTSSNGSVSSPKYPKNYPDKSDCWYHIQVKANHRIKLEFEELILEHSNGCTFDFVEVFDGPNAFADVLGKFCNAKPNEEIESSSDHMLIRFRSDDLVNNKGFRFNFEIITDKNDHVNSMKQFAKHVCPTFGDNSSGIITSPGYPSLYVPYSNCSTELKMEPNYHYILTVEDIDIEYDELCLFDYLEIRDGSTSDSPILAQLCGKKMEINPITSTGNGVFVQFISDAFVEFGGFKVSYQSIFEQDVEYNDESNDFVEEEENEDELIEEEEAEPNPALPEDEMFSNLILERPFNTTIQKGQSLTIDCLRNGSTSAIVWLKDHSFISVENEDESDIQLLLNNSLKIVYMSEDTEGIYTCIVLSEHGAFTINFWIFLENQNIESNDECQIEIIQKPKDTIVLENRNTFFTCFAKAEGEFNITWLKDGEVIKKSSDKNARIQILMGSVLLINQTQQNDSGIYTCQVQDSAGCIEETDAFLAVEHQISLFDQENRKVCGKPKSQNITRSGKVVAGRVASKGSFPWQAMLWEMWVGPFCGGSLISSRWVVTAAHCFTEFQQQFSKNLYPDQLLIKLGKHDRSATESGEQTLMSDKIIIHPKFNKHTYDNDIALVRLSQSSRFTDTVLPVCLVDPKQNIFKDNNRTSVVGSVTGWGTLTEHGIPSTFLQEIRLPLIPFHTCANSTRYPVTTNMFCAGYTRRVMGDACQGDSGGPFTVFHNEQWHLVGIVSWGEGCDREGKYGFYTKVENYIQWIVSVIDNDD